MYTKETRPTKKVLKIKEAAGAGDKKLSERSEFLFICGGGFRRFFDAFLVSLDFFGSFLCQDKNEHIKKQKLILCKYHS